MMKIAVIVLLVALPLARAGMAAWDREAAFRHVMDQMDHGGQDERGDDSGGQDGGRSDDTDCEEGDQNDREWEKNWEMLWKAWSEMNDKDDHRDGNDNDWNDAMRKMMRMMETAKQKVEWKQNKDEGEYERLMRWAREQQRKMDREEREKEMKEKYDKFEDFLENKKEMEDKIREMKMNVYQQMQMIQEKKELIKNLEDTSKENKKQKLMYAYGILTQIMKICQCEDELDVFKRVRNNSFGKAKDDDDMMENDDDNMRMGNGKHRDNDDEMEDMKKDWDVKVSDEEMMKIVMRFLNMSQEERIGQAVESLVKVMCAASKQFFAHLHRVEYYLIQYRMAHGNGNGGRTGNSADVGDRRDGHMGENWPFFGQ